MKRLYGIIVLAVLLALVVGLGIARSPGYILIDYPHVFRYESGLWATLAALLALGLAALVIATLVRAVLASSGVVNPWSRRNRRRRIQAAVAQGQVDLAEGRWASAQRHLRIAAEAERYPLFYYLGAARAANEQGQAEASDALLERALERQPEAELAVALSHAQLQLDRGDTAAARDTLEVMRQRYPRNVQVLRQLHRLHVQTDDWAAVMQLLPDLRQHKALPAAELASVEQQAWRGSLPLATPGNTDRASLDAAWQRLSSAQRQEPALVLAYAEQLRRAGAGGEAEQLLHSALKRRYDTHLIRLYGLVKGADPLKQLQLAEGFLKQQGSDPGLLLTLGRLSLQNSLWGKARDYFESSLRLRRDPEACAELARLLARLGDAERSNQLFQEGLGLLDERLLALPLPPAKSPV